MPFPRALTFLSIEMTGFRRYERKNLQLQVDSPFTADVTLDIGATAETVEVSAAAVTLNTADASLGNAFNENQVKELPIDSRNVPDLLSLQAGVAYTGNRSDINTMTDTRSGAVNGARSDQSNITLDGVDVNTDTTGFAFTSVLPVPPIPSRNFASPLRTTTPTKAAPPARKSRSSPRAARTRFTARSTNTIATR